MRKMSGSEKQRHSELVIAASRRSLQRYGLSATLGIACGLTMTEAASAHGGSVPQPQFLPPSHVNAGAALWHPSSVLHNPLAAKTNVQVTGSSSSAAGALNLQSTSASLSASLLGSFTSITIDVAGKADVVKMSSKLTDAELAACDEVLGGGRQTITINGQGAASGGTLKLDSALVGSLDSALGGSISSITIPKHVTVDDNLASLTLSGNLVNDGSLVAQSGSAAGDTINAGGITNAGTIASGNANLTLNAPVINNSGTISGANINIGSANINNAGGTITATHVISVNNPGGINIEGGNLLSQTLNLNAGASALNVNGTNITGVVNDTAGSAHINATSQNFLLGNSNVSGDPLFDTTGNFTITGSISATGGAPLAIVAGGNITSGAGATLDTSSTAAGGGGLTLIAGADFSVNPATGVLTIIQSNLPNGGSATGGSINLAGTGTNGTPIAAINTSSTVGNGGNVVMVAYAGSGSNSGTVIVPTSVTINTSALATAGSVTIEAGATKGTAISLGNIDASGATKAGQIFLVTSTPVSNTGGLTISAAGKITGGGLNPSSPLAVLPANVLIGSIQDNGTAAAAGQVQIQSGGTVTFTNIDTSGVGGAAGASGAAGANGGAGGNVSILAQGNVTGNNVLTFGGGGGGGGGGIAGTAGQAGGGGGGAGTITVETFTGNITLAGEANASGGSGGGGGGGFSNGTKGGGTGAGAGGGAGGAANIVLSTEGQNTNGAFANPTKSGSVSVLQGVFAVDGVAGGKGVAGANAAGAANAGAGGGGGGSYGGGGGGGAGGLSTTGGALDGAGGGGGGGYWGGGGGDSGTTQNGASGGGAGTPGSTVAGNEATQFSGASGTLSPNSGGSLGIGGLAGTTPLAATNGNSITAATAGNPVFITTNTAIGNVKAPQFIFAPQATLDAAGGSVFATFGGNTVVTAVQSAVGGAISLTADGNLTTGLVSKTGQLTLTTELGSNGNIALTSDIVATKSLIATADGTGTITQAKATDFVSTPLMIATSESGNINLIGGNTIGSFQFNTQGNVNLQNNIAMTVLASAASGNGSVVTITDNNSPISINGNVLVQAGTATFTAGTNIKIGAQVNAPGGDKFVAGNGAITVGATLVNPGPITFTSDFASLGTVMVNAPQVTITANGAKVTDLYVGATTILGAAPFGLGQPSNPAAGPFSFSSAGTSLTVSAGAINGYSSVALTNTSATGSLVFGAGAVTITGTTTLSTVGGNITTAGAATADAILSSNVAVTTKTGNMTEVGGGPFSLETSGFSFIGSPGMPVSKTDPTGSAGSTVNVTSNMPSLIPMQITAITAFNASITSTTTDVDIAGKLAATTIDITSTANNIFQVGTTGSLTGQNITLNAGIDIGISNSTAGLTTTFTGTNPTLNINAGTDANVQSGTVINLGTSTIGRNLTLTSKAAINQSGTVTVGGSSFINAGTFTQLADSTFNGVITDISVTGSGKNSGVVIGGTLVSTTSLFVVTPATSGTLTVNAGGVIDSPTSSFEVGTVTLEPQTGVPNPGLITTSLIPTNAVGSMTFTNTKGNLTFVGGAGNAFGILGASADLTITAGGNITFSPQINYLGSNNEAIASTSKSGIVSLPSASGGLLTVLSSAAGDGGTLSLTAATLQVNGAAPTTNITFNAAAAAAGGNGGTIDVTLTGKGNATIDATPTDAGALNFIANGVGAGNNGGSVSLTNTNGLILWPNTASGINNAPAATGGNGGNLSLISGVGFNITGNISQTPGAGSYGNVTLDVTSGKSSKGVLNIDAGAIGTNFVTGTISGANVTIENPVGINIGGVNAITVENVGFPVNAPPTLTLDTNNVTFAATGTITNPGNLVINSTSNLTFTPAAVPVGAFGTPVALTIDANGNVSVPAALLNLGSENSVSLTATGTLTLPTNTITVVPGAGGNGGTIFISSKLQNFVTGTSGLLQLFAQGGAGAGTNDGGTITYNSTGGANISISNAPGSTLIANVNAGTAGVIGGTFNSTTKGSITLDNGLINTYGVANNIDLNSTGAGVIVTLLATGASGSVANIGAGNLTLDSNSSSTFAIVQTLPAGKFLNGMVAAAALNVGTFTINNTGGGVSFDQLITATVAPVTGFAAVVEAKSNISETLGSAAVAGPSIELASSAGNIGSITQGKVPGVVFQIDGTNAAGTDVSMTVGKSGVVNVQDTSVNNDILVAASPGATYDFASTGSIQTLAPITAGNVTLTSSGVGGNIALGATLGSGSSGKGIVSLNDLGNLSQSQGTIAASTLSFTVGTMTTPIYTTASAIGIGSTATSKLNPTINLVDTSTKGLTLPAVQFPNAGGTILITSAGNIAVTGNIGTTGPFFAQTVSLIATGKGTISESSGVTIEATNLLTLEGASIAGSGKNASIAINTGPTGGLLQLFSPGAIAITDASTAQVSVQSIPGTVASFTLTSAGPVTLNSITATGLIQVTDASGGGAGGITTNAGTNLVSSKQVNLISTNTAAGIGALNINGNVYAPIVNLTSGTGANINLNAIVGGPNAVITLNANTGNIIQNGGVVDGNALSFFAGTIEGPIAGGPNPLITDVQTVTQLSPQAQTNGIYIQDISALPVTITSNNGVSLATNGSAGLAVNSIMFQSTGDLIVQGNVLPGITGVAANVALIAGQSMTLNGNVGVNPAGSTTTITVGNNNLGTGNLFQAKGTSVIGDTVSLNSEFAINGDLGTVTTPINTQANSFVTINETGDGNVANNSLLSANVGLVVSASRSIQFSNTGTAAGGPVLTIGNGPIAPGNVLATSGVGGAIVISNNGLINVGIATDKLAITGNSVDIFNTGTNSASINVADSTTVTANAGSITMTAGTTAGGGLIVGQIGGPAAGVKMTATSGNITLGCAQGDTTGTVAINDSVALTTNASAGGQGSISITSPTTMTINGGGKGLTLTTNNGGNISLTAAGNLTTAAAGLITANAVNGNISISSTGGNVSVDQVALKTAVSKVSTLGGSINISAFGTVDIADQTAGDTLAMTTTGTASGVSVSGTSITMGNATSKNETINVTAGNVTMNATATGGGATGIQLGTNAGDAFTITTGGNASNQGNIALTSAQDIILGSAINFTTASNLAATTAGNITLVAGAATAGFSINLEGGTLKTASNGLASGFITLDGSTASAGSVTIGSVNAATINASGATGSVTVLSNNNLTVADKTNITAGQSLSLIAGDGTVGSALTIGAAAGTGGALTANDGNILLQTDASSTTATAGTINVGLKYNITANALAVPLGNVTLAVDEASGNTSAFATAGNYTVTITGSGSATATTVATVPQFTVLGAGTTFKADFANITIFNIGSGGAGAITFNGTNAIQADPPPPAGAAVTVVVPVLLPTPNSAITTQTARTPDAATIEAGTINFAPGAAGMLPAASGNGSISSPAATLPAGTLGLVVLPAAYSGASSGSLFSSLSSINTLGVQTYGQIYESTGPGQSGSQLQDTENSLGSGYPSASADSTRLLQGGVSARVRGHHKATAGVVAVKELAKGALLLAPETATEVATPFGTVRVDGNAVALVVSTERGLSVYDLDDTRRDSITVQVNGEKISLLPGQHVTVTQEATAGFEHVNPAGYIGYRNVRSQKLNGCYTAYRADFNHLSVIGGLEPLKELICSTDPGKKKLGNHLLKTATLLSTMGAGGAPFELITPPAATAMNR